MTSEEIKQAHSMREVVEHYGFHPDRSGFILCPFHRDNHPSCKVYKDSFYCFSCGAHGDVFTFVEKVEDVSFKDAFKILGGNYQRPTNRSRMRLYHMEKEQEQREYDEQKKYRLIRESSDLLEGYRMFLRQTVPYSAGWCQVLEQYQRELYRNQCLCEGDGD